MIEANAGESVYSFLERVLKYLRRTERSSIVAKHNNVQINVYETSHIYDLCEKYELCRSLNFLTRN